MSAASFLYDANGNMTSDGSNTYTWDSRQRLSTLKGTTSGSFIYEAANRRSQKTIARQTTGYDSSAGDTVVFQPHPGGNPPGYIEIFISDQLVSNFNKNHFSPGIGHENSTYQIYRAPNQ
ncbi:hypothetical protein LOY28_11450 [Pseudomonas sp. B21-017]|uniref:hypothetical protein n=1 Tax=Pseudomonas sp. B21-017 TaxID=2895474 RepID=UPI00215F1725|nr:hypothetical protein [Pseudomonas sp. B21-017]UVM40977.1 hypothetical protein LOY28_11450 [Pseudomonas sp. B21-017]